MGYRFSKLSKKHLAEAHPALQALFEEAIKIVNFRVIEGHREKEEQNRLYEAGKSKLKFPKSKHNQTPSLAVDVVPYPIDWNDKARFYHFAGIIKGLAYKMGLTIRWGGDWDSDNDFKDQTFHDLPHFELVIKSTTKKKKGC